jgi:hypothetical protein
LFWGSAVPALVWSVIFADIMHRVPVIASANRTGSFFDPVNPYALVGGLTMLSLFTLHGATFLGLKADGTLMLGEVRRRHGDGPLVLISHQPHDQIGATSHVVVFGGRVVTSHEGAGERERLLVRWGRVRWWMSDGTPTSR